MTMISKKERINQQKEVNIEYVKMNVSEKSAVHKL
jgi:hypothetical protein